ncbi:disintegrin and metalloproteinase domain-containing protein 17-like [Sinocyclocheilus grahami]|nr:PREDICTED: disintegrin and metalloproteinase domain-containing protein 17-like [Sinocyclocheilus grahami]
MESLICYLVLLAPLSIHSAVKPASVEEDLRNQEDVQEFDELSSILSDFDVVPASDLQLHSVGKRDVDARSHVERLVSFTALQR